MHETLCAQVLRCHPGKSAVVSHYNTGCVIWIGYNGSEPLPDALPDTVVGSFETQEECARQMAVPTFCKCGSESGPCRAGGTPVIEKMEQCVVDRAAVACDSRDGINPPSCGQVCAH